MLHLVQHYANEAARVVQDLCKSCRVPVILLYFISGAYYAIMMLKELCKTCASIVRRYVIILFNFILAQSGTILAQEFI